MFRKGYLWFCVLRFRYGAIFGGSVFRVFGMGVSLFHVFVRYKSNIKV